jgi:hypothetical protein
MNPADIPQSVPDRFFKVASDTMRAAMLGQYGPTFTAEQLRTELQNNITNLIPNWSAFDAPYVLTPPEMVQVSATLEQAVDKYEAWIGAGRPAIQ